jgi:hypothetical protein
MDMEQIWYEVSPFLYTVAGGFLLGKADSALLLISSLLLLAAGGTILMLRRMYSINQIRRLKVAAA